MRTDLNEMHLIKHFKQDAVSLFKNTNSVHSHDWLFIMRHYGVPTRLLDWTESALVATYFATELNDEVDGSLWMLFPLKLNQQEDRHFSNIEVSLPSFEEDSGIMEEYEPRDRLKTLKKVQLNPIAFICPRNISRMRAQRSVYTIHHLSTTPIEKVGDKSHAWRYIIPKESKPQIRKELSVLGFNKFQVFPDAKVIADKLFKECQK